jgi:hypothetical protein
MDQVSPSTHPPTLPSLEDEQAIRWIVDLLFIYTDQKAWSQARQIFVDGPIEVDMGSLNEETGDEHRRIVQGAARPHA